MSIFIPPESDRELVQVAADQIKRGMYMAYPDRPWLETPFLFQGFILDNDEIINQVKQECRFIYVDMGKSWARKRPKPPKVAGPDKYKITKSVEEVFDTAYQRRNQTLDEIKRTLVGIERGEGINVTRVREQVKTCVDSIVENPNAMLWLGKLRNKDEYTAEHCLNVGILAIALGRHLGLDKAKLETLGMCGMLHDVGKMQVDQDILNKPGRLTEEEFDVIKTHTTFGKQILQKDRHLPREVIDAAWAHHERIDGSGYPRGMEAATLHLFTRIISIVDCYDAITTNRCYDKSRPATEAIKVLFTFRDKQFDGWLVEQFIACLGIYPTGSLVELFTGEGAVVIDSNKTSRLHPKVTIVLDEEKHFRKPLVVDTKQYEDEPDSRTIRQVLDENDFNIDLENVFAHFRSR